MRNDWNSVKDGIMKMLLIHKFACPEHKSKLDSYVGDIIEYNTWHDNYWGSCTCQQCNDKGKNVLGKLIEEIKGVIYVID